MRVWIDLANSPHALLFAPVSKALADRGHDIVVTARDHAHTVALARDRWQSVEVVGGESPPGRAAKARTLQARIRALRRWAREHRPDVALSHNSYGQIVAARSLGVPVVTAMDFEYQPANNLGFRLANRVLLPEPFPERRARHQGATASKRWRYPGVKEALYLGDFQPDPRVVRQLGIEPDSEAPLVVARTPPTRALYHRRNNPLFLDSLRALSRRGGLHCVVLTRYPEQRQSLACLPEESFIVPAVAVDARSLIYQADLVLGGGGTMTREAALMGVQTFSVFRGRTPAVDRWLEERGLLRRLKSPAGIPGLRPGMSHPRSPDVLRGMGKPALDSFIAAVETPIAR